MSKQWPAVLGLIVAMTMLPGARAEPPPRAQAEITLLLALVGSSGCRFFRNGTWYDAARAQEHLRFKYEYLAAHDRVASADDFIERAATRSSLSGQPYLLLCGSGKPVASEEWLRAALARYRSSVDR